MPVMRTYRCGDCGHEVEVLHMNRTDPPPSSCAVCDSLKAPDRQLSAPHIARPIGKSADSVYRQMEESSQARAEHVAEFTGESSGTTAMKITDMNDHQRAGDIAAMRTVTPTTPNNMMAPSAALEYARMTAQGPFPGAGAAAARAISTTHHERRHAILQGGMKG